MANISEELLKTLEDLSYKDLELFQWYLRNGVGQFNRIPKASLENAKIQDIVDVIVNKYGDIKAKDVTLTILKKINQNQLAEELRTRLAEANIKRKNPVEKDYMKRHLQQKCSKLYDRTSLEDDDLLLKDIYTDLYVIKGCTGGVHTEHEVRQIETYYPKSKEIPVKFSDLFKVQSNENAHGTKVLTLGIAGVGKTASVHKFILDWAEEKSNQDLDFVLFLPFRELNVIKDEHCSLLNLLRYFHHELCDEEAMEILKGNSKMILILDGLDESKINLDFAQKKVSDLTEETTLGKLIINLIKGHLLPSALIWITSRPAAASQIPCHYFDHITEIRGFNDSQKEEFFRKRIHDQHQASKIISHVKSARSLHILCHIPVFCKITAAVLQDILDGNNMGNAPTTLTEMYTHFLLFQTRQKSEKYSTKTDKDGTVPPTKRDSLNASYILKLGKLAFLQLQKGKLIFYESDLKECDIDVNEATLYSGVCTQIFKKHEMIFSFVHLSFQEFLAAVFVFLSFIVEHNPPLPFQEKFKWKRKHTLNDLLKTAVKGAMKNHNGQLDLFVRFLLGLSLKSNQTLLKGLLPEMEIKEDSLQDTIDYIKKIINKTRSSEKSINLFYCLSELKDSSLTTQIQTYLDSGNLTAQKLSSTQWSALAFVLLMSKESQEMFDLKKYRSSDEGLRRLLPVVKNTEKALLDYCNLNKDSCKALTSVLSSSLKELDLSNNDLWDSGVEQLCAFVKSSNCKLEKLRLSGCLVTEKGCSFLDSALTSNPSHLKELDLTYNHPGDSGKNLLNAKLNDSGYRLETLRIGYAGSSRMKPGPRKYACDITLDPNTAHPLLSLSERNQKVECAREQTQQCPDHPERFDGFEQVLSREMLTGCCYWEVEWSDEAEIAVAYKGICRKGSSEDCMFGWNKMSWSLIFSNNRFSVWHDKKRTNIPAPPFRSNRAGVYLDELAGTLSFYSVSNDTTAVYFLLFTFHSKFTEPLYAGLRVQSKSSVSVCQI